MDDTLFGKPEPKKPRASRGLADDCIGWWRETYPREVRDATGQPVRYHMHPGDGAAVAKLVREEPDLTLALFQRRALALLRSRKPFWIESRNLRMLCSRWSDIASLEVAEAVKNAPPKKSHLGNPQTFVPDPSFSDEMRRQAREAEERFKRMRPR